MIVALYVLYTNATGGKAMTGRAGSGRNTAYLDNAIGLGCYSWAGEEEYCTDTAIICGKERIQGGRLLWFAGTDSAIIYDRWQRNGTTELDSKPLAGREGYRRRCHMRQRKGMR